MSTIIDNNLLAEQDLIQLVDQVADLAEAPDPQACESLFALLGHEHPFVRWQATDALAKHVARAHQQREPAWARALGRAQRPDLQDLMAMAAQALESGAATQRAAVIEALGQWRYNGSLPLLQEALNDTDAGVRSAAALALGQMRDIDSAERLLETLQKDASLWVRVAAADALGALGDARIVPGLHRIIEQMDQDIHSPELAAPQHAAAQTLLRTHLINALGHLRHPQSRAILMEYAEHTDPTYRWYAARGLMRIGDAAALTVLKRLLTDEHVVFDRTVASVAQEALHEIGHREQGLGAWLRQASYQVARFAKQLWRARQR